MKYTLREISSVLEEIAPLSLQENYDNSGLIIGNPEDITESALICLDVTEEIIDEAIQKKCGVIIAHHPLIFSGMKQLNGKNWIERCVIKAIRNNIAIYAIHTNLDNVLHRGVNERIAQQLELQELRILRPMSNRLLKLNTFVPHEWADKVRESLFAAGAGHIGRYDACSFNITGTGTFRAGEGAQPFIGTHGEVHHEPETRIEVILPDFKKNQVLKALYQVHPYEEVAYDMISLANEFQEVGAGVVGLLPEVFSPEAFLEYLKSKMETTVIRHTKFEGSIKKVAICGGSGSFLLRDAISAQADVFITADFKYHQFFDAESKLMIADIGHYESEKYTIPLLQALISEKIPNFALFLAETKTNPIQYFI